VTPPPPWQPIPAPDHSFREEILPHSQPETPLAQLQTTPSSPVARYVGEKADLHLTTAFFQGVEESYKSPLSLLWIKQSHFPQLLLPIRLVFQTPHHFLCSSPDTLQGLNDCLVTKSLRPSTFFGGSGSNIGVWLDEVNVGLSHYPHPLLFLTPEYPISSLGALGDKREIPPSALSRDNTLVSFVLCVSEMCLLKAGSWFSCSGLVPVLLLCAIRASSSRGCTCVHHMRLHR